jgi:hypothetical protein
MDILDSYGSLNHLKDIDVALDHIQVWYPTLWNHKAMFYMYQIHDSFLRRCKEILIGEVPEPVTREARDFLKGKWDMYVKDE